MKPYQEVTLFVIITIILSAVIAFFIFELIPEEQQTTYTQNESINSSDMFKFINSNQAYGYLQVNDSWKNNVTWSIQGFENNSDHPLRFKIESKNNTYSPATITINRSYVSNMTTTDELIVINIK